MGQVMNQSRNAIYRISYYTKQCDGKISFCWYITHTKSDYIMVLARDLSTRLLDGFPGKTKRVFLFYFFIFFSTGWVFLWNFIICGIPIDG